MATGAPEKATLYDVRAAIKSAQGILFFNTEIKPNSPILEPFQEMADDISSWFDSAQRWTLTAVTAGVINLKRIEQSITEDSVAKLIAKKEQPDSFTPVFHYHSDNPRTKGGRFGIPRSLDLSRVFSQDFRINAVINGTSADVYPNHIGSVYPVEQALKEASGPYYLHGVTIYQATRAIPEGQSGADLSVTVYMGDLVDYTRLEVNRLRRLKRQMEKHFPPQDPTPQAQSA